MNEVKIIEDSLAANGKRITTFQLKYPRYIHAELMTHRVFSRNASSSRAIPVKKMLAQIWGNPVMPIEWGANQSGMQSAKLLSPIKEFGACLLWRSAAKAAAAFSWGLMQVGLHKQWANRITEPFQYIHVIVTATEYSNFFELRAHTDAQPEIHALAVDMLKALQDSTPVKRKVGEWHLPYVSKEERAKYDLDTLKKVSAARCCRVSYLKHDGSMPSIEEDLKLYDRLVGSEPIHASPVEHQATPVRSPTAWSGNFQGWHQYRKDVEAQFVKTFHVEDSAEPSSNYVNQ